MAWKQLAVLRNANWMLLAVALLCCGCISSPRFNPIPDGSVPRELSRQSIPEYVISPPDILQLNVIRLVPRPPYKIATLDSLLIQVEVALADRPPVAVDPLKEPAKYADELEQSRHLRRGQPIEAVFKIEPDGNVDLGFEYGTVRVANLTIPEAKAAIKLHLQQTFKVNFDVRVALAESQALQQIRGEHLVRPDGKITLGSYGSVYVTGMTLEQAKAAIQDFLSSRFLDPEISLDVSGYNSMVYYVIFDLDGAGQSLTRMPFTGNETVLDALSELKGLPGASDRFNMWVARPLPADTGCDQILPIDWQAICMKGKTGTNYQLFPGDRLYVAVDPLVAADGFLAKITAPFERIFGFMLLGNSTVRTFRIGSGTGIGAGGF